MWTLDYNPVEGLGDMPEFGMLLKMDADYDQIRYYGYGPNENYVDRREGARLGIFATTAKENVFRYLVPQECGNHTGVRWAEVTDHTAAAACVLRAARWSSPPCRIRRTSWKTPCTTTSLPIHYTVIRANLQQMGVGGDDSGVWQGRTTSI